MFRHTSSLSRKIVMPDSQPNRLPSLVELARFYMMCLCIKSASHIHAYTKSSVGLCMVSQPDERSLQHEAHISANVRMGTLDNTTSNNQLIIAYKAYGIKNIFIFFMDMLS